MAILAEQNGFLRLLQPTDGSLHIKQSSPTITLLTCQKPPFIQ